VTATSALTRPAAERAVLGACMLDSAAADWLPVTPEHFADPRHRAIWESMLRIREAGSEIDVVSLEHALAGRLEAVGGLAYVGELVIAAPLTDALSAHCDVLDDVLVARRMAVLLDELRGRLLGQGESGGTVLDRAFEQMAGIAQHSAEIGHTLADGAGEELRALYADLDRIGEIGTAANALPFGIDILDRKVGGAPLGVLTVVGARPGVGKSSFLVQVAFAATRDPGDGFVILTWEDRHTAFVRKFIARVSGVALDVIARRAYEDGSAISTKDCAAVKRAAESLRTRHNLLIVNCHGRTFREVSRLVRAHMRRFTVRGFGADYAQNISTPAQGLSTTDRISENVLLAEELAGTDNIAGILLSQFNRNNDKDQRRPRLSDFKGSGKLEESGKLVLALHDPAETEENVGEDALDILILKHFQGKAGQLLPVRFDRAHCRFGNEGGTWS